MRKQILILGSLVIVVGLYAFLATLWDMSLPLPVSPHDASSSYKVQWVSGNDTWDEGTQNEIDTLDRTYDVKILDSSNRNVTSEFAIGHAFLSAATAQSNTITLYSDNPGSNGEHGRFLLNTYSGFRLWVVAYRSASAEYVVEYVELFDNDGG